MKVGFAGTPEFARIALDALIASSHAVVLVMTQPDRPRGRGQKRLPSPVKVRAQAAQIPVYQPHSLRLGGQTPIEAETMHQVLLAARLDVLVVAAYGLILPQSVLALPRLGCLNIHASLLPRWRGAAPIQRAIEAGDEVSGVTLMQMDAGLDTGAMLGQVPLAIDHRTAGELTLALADLGASAMVDALNRLESGPLVALPQPDEGVTYAAKVMKTEARLDARNDAVVLERRIRAFNPAPGATLMLGKDTIKIWRSRAKPGVFADAGRVLEVNAEGIVLACGHGALVIEEVQAPGGRREPAAQFARRVALCAGMQAQ